MTNPIIAFRETEEQVDVQSGTHGYKVNLYNGKITYPLHKGNKTEHMYKGSYHSPISRTNTHRLHISCYKPSVLLCLVSINTVIALLICKLLLCVSQ